MCYLYFVTEQRYVAVNQSDVAGANQQKSEDPPSVTPIDIVASSSGDPADTTNQAPEQRPVISGSDQAQEPSNNQNHTEQDLGQSTTRNRGETEPKITAMGKSKLIE